MIDDRPLLGSRGEAAAEAHLTRLGYRILERRFRSRLGEIDLIAEHGDVVVFVEVKTRRTSGFGSPEESVTPAKQRKIARMAAFFLASRGWAGRDCRFDVVAVEERGDEPVRLRHLPDAFRC